MTAHQATGGQACSGSCSVGEPMLSWPIRTCLTPLSWVYGAAARLRAGGYRAGLFARHALPCRVISIGNVTVGGTGKTPVTIFVASRLIEHGYRVGILSRGYRRSGSQDMALVSDGRRTLLGPDEGGDEPYLIARRCPQAVVAVGADRARLGGWVLNRIPLDVLVLDDGFQHLSLDRDVNLLLLDASAPESMDQLLPAGRLREPLTAASRASAIVVTRAETPHSSAALLSRLARARVPARPTIQLRFFHEALTDLQGGTTTAIDGIRGARVVTGCGIANPRAFRRDVDRLHVTVVDEVAWPDHHRYSLRDAERLMDAIRRAHADYVLTTEKDAVKLAQLASGHELERLCRVVRLGVEVLDGAAELDRLLMVPRTGAQRDDPASRP